MADLGNCLQFGFSPYYIETASFFKGTVTGPFVNFGYLKNVKTALYLT